jgi:AmmeMemoRadiSam system protein A
MSYARKIAASRITLLKYGNSGDTAGAKDRVVGYAAIVFSGGELNPLPENTDARATEDEGEFSLQDRLELLKLARLTVETVAKTGGQPAWTNSLAGLEKKRGAFVTLREHGQLRGCIGHFEADMPIYRTVIEMAIAAATQDNRFRPVSPTELGAIDYEISVLSPLRKISNWREIQLGKHGVQVVRGFHRGVFLPQVATETGWDLETFMGELCSQKAGLPEDAWKDPKTDLYVFTAEVFGDTE